MNKYSERYNTRVEIPISVILETIFTDDNHDVETLCRWAKKYGFVDFDDKCYKLQSDYTKQSFFRVLDKEERKQYDYETYLTEENDKLQQENKQLKDNEDKAKEYIVHEIFKRRILLGLSEKKYMKNILFNILQILNGDDE